MKKTKWNISRRYSTRDINNEIVDNWYCLINELSFYDLIVSEYYKLTNNEKTLIKIKKDEVEKIAWYVEYTYNCYMRRFIEILLSFKIGSNEYLYNTNEINLIRKKFIYFLNEHNINEEDVRNFKRFFIEKFYIHVDAIDFGINKDDTKKDLIIKKYEDEETDIFLTIKSFILNLSNFYFALEITNNLFDGSIMKHKDKPYDQKVDLFLVHKYYNPLLGLLFNNLKNFFIFWLNENKVLNSMEFENIAKKKNVSKYKKIYKTIEERINSKK